MRGRDDAKLMARSLRREMAARGLALTHSECLETVARIVGEADWNTLSARLDRAPPVTLRESDGPDAEPVDVHWADITRPWYERHFTPDDLKVPAIVRRTKWKALFDEANRLYASGIDSESAEMIDLARRWIACSWETSGDNLEYKRKSARAYGEALDDPAVGPKLPLGREVLEFIEAPLQRAMRERLRTNAGDE